MNPCMFLKTICFSFPNLPLIMIRLRLRHVSINLLPILLICLSKLSITTVERYRDWVPPPPPLGSIPYTATTMLAQRWANAGTTISDLDTLELVVLMLLMLAILLYSCFNIGTAIPDLGTPTPSPG